MQWNSKIKSKAKSIKRENFEKLDKETIRRQTKI